MSRREQEQQQNGDEQQHTTEHKHHHTKAQMTTPLKIEHNDINCDRIIKDQGGNNVRLVSKPVDNSYGDELLKKGSTTTVDELQQACDQFKPTRSLESICNTNPYIAAMVNGDTNLVPNGRERNTTPLINPNELKHKSQQELDRAAWVNKRAGHNRD